VKKLTYEGLSALAGLMAALVARKVVSALWRGDTEPPLNPADRRISWREALIWALATGVGAGVARVIALRGTAAGWESATGAPPPGVQTA
jgi:hypothetical protein